ncbi:exopolysaccharide biosynthesis protein [Salipiger sp. CCB-MM3]|uniref:exopolysaccharide biosynthesis protein n=1 Tax=Salipiger sp. CCB-MM3 TaxID=1792508 RepID=UPI0009F29E32|nr:exopolysaccharide biosynthesis protein [Salipiger sp. CCB-MM3]
MTDRPLEGIMHDLSELGDSDGCIEVQEVVRTLESRGFGPLLIVLAAFLMLPIGMIPGVPALIGLLFILCGAQMMRGKSGVWLPSKIASIEFPADKFTASIKRAWPKARSLRRYLGSRMTWAASGTISRVIAVLLIFAGAAVIGLGFVPGLPFLVAVPVLLFGLGLTLRDGLLIILAFALLGPALWAGAAWAM